MRRRIVAFVFTLAMPFFIATGALSADDEELLGDEDLEILEEVEGGADEEAVDEAGEEGAEEGAIDEDVIDRVVEPAGDDLQKELDLIEGAEEAEGAEDEDVLKLTDEGTAEDFGIKMVFIQGGCFMMGDTFGDGHKDERPAHEVCVDDFYISETEMTQKQLEQLMGFNTSRWTTGPEYPAEYINWSDANYFMKKLNEKTGRFFRFPSEAEWEYAARERGKKMRWAGTDNESEVGDYAWFDDNAGGQIQPVKTKKPNALGLYDMNGNVWEWVYDYYDMNYYQRRAKDNPEGPEFAIWRGLRGGSYGDPADKLRNASRYGRVPHIRRADVGIRLAE